jgi:hypothetical protein
MLVALVVVGRLSDAFVPRLIAGTIVPTAGLLVALLMSYWRVSNLPATLLHFTTSATADRIVTATRPDGTYDAVFVARPSPVKWLLPSVHPCKPRSTSSIAGPDRWASALTESAAATCASKSCDSTRPFDGTGGESPEGRPRSTATSALSSAGMI